MRGNKRYEKERKKDENKNKTHAIECYKLREGGEIKITKLTN